MDGFLKSSGKVDISTLFWDKSRDVILIADDSMDMRYVAQHFRFFFVVVELHPKCFDVLTGDVALPLAPTLFLLLTISSQYLSSVSFRSHS